MLDVAEEHLRGGGLGSNLLGHPGIPRTGAAGHARLVDGLVQRIGAVEPQHSGGSVIPNAHDEHHPTVECPAHRGQAALLAMVIDIAEFRFGGGAHLVGNGVVSGAAQRDCRISVHHAVLDIQAADFDEVAGVRAVGGDELSHDCHGAGRVYGKLGTWPVECAISETIGVEVAPVLVADPFVALVGVVVSARCPFASV